MDIKLKNNYGIVAEKDLFKTSDKLVFNFVTEYALTDYIVSLSDGEHKDNYRLKNTNTFVVPEKYYKAGNLFVEVRLVAKAMVVKTFVCEPIAIKEVDGELMCIKAYDELKQELNATKCRYDVLLNEVKKLTAKVDVVKAQIKELWETEEQ